MKILITAGGTIEKIDEVRHITNNSTGSLGRAIANAFLDNEQVEKVFYVCGLAAVVPREDSRVVIIRITDVQELKSTLERIFESERIDGIVHCMAVSDYTVDNVTTSELLVSELSDKMDLPNFGELLPSVVNSCLHDENSLASSGKISSDMSDLLIVLKKTPKIIGMLKSYQPQAVLVGFKLLNGVTEEILIDTGRSLMKKNDCDFVFANDLTELSPERHCGYLIKLDGSYNRIEGREKIANAIAESVVEEAARRKMGYE